MSKISDLKFTRITDPDMFQLVPRYLFEQIDGLDKEAIDLIYNMGASVLTIPLIREKRLVRIANPFVWIVVLSNSDHKIKGFLWFDINVIEKHIFIKIFSVDKEYQSTSNAVSKELTDYIFSLPIDEKYKGRILAQNAHPKAAERHGWKRSKNVLIEIERS